MKRFDTNGVSLILALVATGIFGICLLLFLLDYWMYYHLEEAGCKIIKHDIHTEVCTTETGQRPWVGYVQFCFDVKEKGTVWCNDLRRACNYSQTDAQTHLNQNYALNKILKCWYWSTDPYGDIYWKNFEDDLFQGKIIMLISGILMAAAYVFLSVEIALQCWHSRQERRVVKVDRSAKNHRIDKSKTNDKEKEELLSDIDLDDTV